MDNPNIRIYRCFNAYKCGLDDDCEKCRFSELHTSSIGCICDFYMKQEIHSGV